MAEEEQQVNDADFDGLDDDMGNMGAEEGGAEGLDVSDLQGRRQLLLQRQQSVDFIATSSRLLW
jgi:hypothetical protein